MSYLQYRFELPWVYKILFEHLDRMGDEVARNTDTQPHLLTSLLQFSIGVCIIPLYRQYFYHRAPLRVPLASLGQSTVSLGQDLLIRLEMRFTQRKREITTLQPNHNIIHYNTQTTEAQSFSNQSTILPFLSVSLGRHAPWGSSPDALKPPGSSRVSWHSWRCGSKGSSWLPRAKGRDRIQGT